MLLNLSNHPSQKWTTAQRSTADYYYQRVLDMVFPDIDPEWTTQQVSAFAMYKCSEIVALKPDAVHIMGEMTFTYALVNLLKAAGIKCIASTTKRNVEEVDGKQISTFQFVQFREY